MLIQTASLHALAATMTTDTESRPVAVRAWLLAQTEPVEVPAEGLAVFADAGIFAADDRLSYAECIGLDGARLYGDTVAVSTTSGMHALTEAEVIAAAALPIGRSHTTANPPSPGATWRRDDDGTWSARRLTAAYPPVTLMWGVSIDDVPAHREEARRLSDMLDATRAAL